MNTCSQSETNINLTPRHPEPRVEMRATGGDEPQPAKNPEKLWHRQASGHRELEEWRSESGVPVSPNELSERLID